MNIIYQNPVGHKKKKKKTLNYPLDKPRSRNIDRFYFKEVKRANDSRLMRGQSGKPIIFKGISRGMTVRSTCASILPFCHLDKFPFSR